MIVWDSLIIGAGITGLTAGRVLHKHHQKLLILDKARGIGGRAATRRLGDARADHGAPCFHLDQPQVGELWRPLLAELNCQPAPAELDAEAWICPAGINALAKELGKGLPIETSQTVRELRYAHGLWHCTTIEGRLDQSRQLLVTSPLWQTAEFFKDHHNDLQKQIQILARKVGYRPQWTLILTLGTSTAFPRADFSFQAYHSSPIASIYEQGSKGRPASQGVLVVQTSQEFSDRYIEAEAKTVIELLKPELTRLGWDLSMADIQAHRWRYARVGQPLQQPSVRFEAYPGLILAGDFCLASTIMGAAESALAASAMLLPNQS